MLMVLQVVMEPMEKVSQRLELGLEALQEVVEALRVSWLEVSMAR